MTFKPTKSPIGTTGGFIPTKKPIKKNEAISNNASSFFTKNEPTPLYFDKNGNFNGVITAYGTKANPNGLDIWAPPGTEIRYPISGKIVEVETGHKKGEKNYGNYVVVEYKEGKDTYKLRIAHMDKVNVKKGDTIVPYSTIGTVGNTGYVIDLGGGGYHSDNTMWKNGKLITSPTEVKNILYSKLPSGVIEGAKTGARENIKNYLPLIEDQDPELAKLIKSEGIGRKIGTEAFGVAEGITSGAGNILKYLDPTYWLSEATGMGKGETFGGAVAKGTSEQTKLSEQQLREGGWINKPSELSKTAGELIPATIATSGMSPLLGILSKAPGVLSKVLPFLTGSLGSTSALTAATEGRMPSGKELGAYSFIDLMLGGLAKGGSKLYQSAFKPGKITAEKYQRYGTTLGEAAEKFLGKAGTPTRLERKAQQAIDMVKETLLTEAKRQGGNISRTVFKDMAKVASQKATVDMYASEAKDLLSKEVKNAIMKFAPKTRTSYTGIVNMLPKINASIFTKVGVPSLSKAAGLAGEAKRALKTVLSKDITKQYPKYETLIDIKSLMKKKTLQPTVSPSLWGISKVAAGALAGGVGGYTQGGLPGTALGIAGGIIAPQAAQSTLGRTLVGKTLKNAPIYINPLVKTLAKKGTEIVTEKVPFLKNILNKFK
jgi:hypothetical protein